MSSTSPKDNCQPHPASIEPETLLKQCETRRQRRSGPGGQHRNKVETGIILTHRPTGVRAEATERRSQADNLRVAVERLRVNIALEVRVPRDPEKSPSEGWAQRSQNGRMSISRQHADFSALLAELLDSIHSVEYDLKAAAEQLGVTTSQLVRVLKLEPRALKLVNDRRVALGLRRFR